MNIDIETMAEFQKRNKNPWMPMSLRKSVKVGIIFTKNSLFYFYHMFGNGKEHDWGNYK